MTGKHDYKKLGFKCGIEIHQQLDTHKLFCDCPSIVHDTKPDIHFTRRLRPVAGETGEIDSAAMHEVLKGKYYSYEAYSTSSCLVEMDEEPPHQPNMEALMIALEIAKHLNMKIVDELQFMRKTVIDGSNVSGFQRTGMIGYDGYVETSKGRVGILGLFLEEEAAQKAGQTGKCIKYRLDRLGVPMIEIATAPDIIDAEHAKETAEKIGMILRSAKVLRGIGTIRQDVNVSIKGGARTEIKGFQDLKSIPKVIEKEIDRQLGLIKKKKKTEKTVRKANPDFTTTFLRPMPGSARMYPETDVVPVRLKGLEVETSELIEEKVVRFEKMGIAGDLAKKLAKSGMADVFDKCLDKMKNIKPAFIAETLISAPREIRRKHDEDISGLKADDYIEIFKLIDGGTLSKDVILDILIDKSKGKFDIGKYKGMSDAEIEKAIKKIIDSNKGAPMGALMGKAMAELRGKADGRKVNEILRKIVG